MAQRYNAPAPALPVPKKPLTGLIWQEYYGGEVHPSDQYRLRIALLLQRPKSTPALKSDPWDLYNNGNDDDSFSNSSKDDGGCGILIPTAQNTVTSVQPAPVALAPFQIDYYGDLKRAQSLYGPNARVLIGNLPFSFKDDDLAGIVETAFGEYGDCVACVFRGGGKGGHLRPYAIVQYTEHQDALAAYYCGQEKMVMGREVRVEFSRLA